MKRNSKNRNPQRPQMKEKEEDRPTMSVPEAGRRYFGLGRNAAYAAAKRGEIPTVQIGSRLFAVKAAIEHKLEICSEKAMALPG
jgi:hypothetical protein